MVELVFSNDSTRCSSCGKTSDDSDEFRTIKMSLDGKNAICSGSLCRECREILLWKLKDDLFL